LLEALCAWIFFFRFVNINVKWLLFSKRRCWSINQSTRSLWSSRSTSGFEDKYQKGWHGRQPKRSSTTLVYIWYSRCSRGGFSLFLHAATECVLDRQILRQFLLRRHRHYVVMITGYVKSYYFNTSNTVNTMIHNIMISGLGTTWFCSLIKTKCPACKISEPFRNRASTEHSYQTISHGVTKAISINQLDCAV